MIPACHVCLFAKKVPLTDTSTKYPNFKSSISHAWKYSVKWSWFMLFYIWVPNKQGNISISFQHCNCVDHPNSTLFGSFIPSTMVSLVFLKGFINHFKVFFALRRFDHHGIQIFHHSCSLTSRAASTYFTASYSWNIEQAN